MMGTAYAAIDPCLMRKVLKEHKLEDESVLLREVGFGNRIAPLIARQLTDENTLPRKKRQKGADTIPLTIKGTEGLVVNFPKCCLPIPGDPILGFVTAGRGIVIHHQSCPNINEYRNHPDKWINVEWESNIASEFPTNIRVEVTNQRGVLATIASVIASQGANISNVGITDNDDRYMTLKFVIEVKDRVHLANVMRRLRNLKHVSRISRR